MSVSGIHGQLLEVTVVECNKLKDTEWISRQDPYVCLEYATTKFRTRTCTDGGKNPIFQEKFVFTLIEGLREINVVVWNSNTVTYDDFIGSGRVLLEDVLCRGYDDRSWPLQTKTGRHAGGVTLIMHYANANANANPFGSRSIASVSPSAPPYQPSPQPQAPMYSTPPVSSMPHTNPTPAYPPPPSIAYPPPPTTAYPPPATAYPPISPYPYPRHLTLTLMILEILLLHLTLTPMRLQILLHHLTFLQIPLLLHLTLLQIPLLLHLTLTLMILQILLHHLTLLQIPLLHLTRILIIQIPLLHLTQTLTLTQELTHLIRTRHFPITLLTLRLPPPTHHRIQCIHLLPKLHLILLLQVIILGVGGTHRHTKKLMLAPPPVKI